MTGSNMENRAAGELGPILTLWTWFEANRRRVTITAAIVVVVGIVLALVLSWKNRQVVQASEALSDLMAPGAVQQSGAITPEKLLSLAAEHPGTGAGARAQLQAAGLLFTEGKYAEAQTQFQRFLAENPDHLFVPQATYGIAATLEALGKTEDAAKAYRQIADRFKAQGIGFSAASALGRILESQGKYLEAMPLFEEVARGDANGMLGGEARLRLAQIQQKLPPSATTTIDTKAP